MNLGLVLAAAILGCLYVIGFAMLGSTLWGAWQSTQAAGWPTTAATITALELHDDNDGEATTHEVKVQYTYSVDGQAYAGSTLAFGYCASSGRKAHDDIFQRLKQAKGVSVRYDPANPSVSCLSFGLHRTLQVLFAFAVTWLSFLMGVSLILWLFSWPDSVLLNNLLVQ